MPISETINPTEWRDSWRFLFGIEYDPIDWLSLRAGYSWETSPMTSVYADYTIPTDGRQTYSLGLGFHNKAWSLDVSFMHVVCDARSYQNKPILNGGTGTLDSTGKMYAEEVVLSVAYNF
jgi:long-chain fatty acid transport protein